MRWFPLLYLGVSAIFQECYAMMPGIFGGTLQQKMMKLKEDHHQLFQKRSPGQTCDIIPNTIGLPYPEYHAADSRYTTKLLSLNSYVCADMKFAEPYYKMEVVHLFDEIDHHILDPEREPGVERSIGIHDNGFILGLAKYYDLKKKPFNTYTGKYLIPPKSHSKHKPPKDQGTVKPSKPKHKKKPRVSSDSNPQAKNTVPILDAKVAHKKVTDSGGSETIEEPDRDSSASKNDAKEVAEKAKDRGKSKLDKGKSRKEIAKDKKSRKEDAVEKGKEEKKKKKRRHHRNK